MGSGIFGFVPDRLFSQHPGVICKRFSATSVAFPEPLVPHGCLKLVRLGLEWDNLDMIHLFHWFLMRRYAYLFSFSSIFGDIERIWRV